MIATEEGAKRWLQGVLHVPRETLARLSEFIQLLVAENSRQNLVSASSLQHIWSRHIVDSAQLILQAGDSHQWLDIGSGAGFPGLVIALIQQGPVTLVEPRRLRADFLRSAAATLGIAPIIVDTRIEQLPSQTFDVIAARAVAPLVKLIGLAAPFSTTDTRFLFPKGRNAQSELEEAQRAWQGRFRSEPSLTDDEARIVIIEELRGARQDRGPDRGSRKVS